MHPRSAGIAIALFSIVACAKSENRPDSSAAMAASSPPVGGTTAAASTTSAPGLTDPNIVYILDQANAADSARGKLAESKATSADVKKFGRLMVGEHHGLRVA